ncbi:MAG: hypothetical protein RIR75_413, partial [Actinomycetota bacterium]
MAMSSLFASATLCVPQLINLVFQ